MEPNTHVADLSAFMPVETFEYEVLDPSRTKGTGWKVTFVSDSHPKALTHSNKNQRETMRRQKLIEAAQINGRKWKPEDKDPEDVRRANAEWIASRIVGWTPFKLPPLYPEPVEFSDAKCVEMMMNPKLGWIFAQFVDVLVDDKSFTRRSAES